MIQFNLLPDVKAQFIKAQRIKRLVISGAFLVTIISAVIFVALLAYVDVSQKQHLKDLSKDVAANSSELTSNSDLSKILTVQNQLQAIPQLDDAKPAVTRLATYVTELTPSTVSISELNINWTTNTFSITGGANGLTDVNQFVDDIKFATYTVGNSTAKKNAFSTVVLSSFGYTSQSSNGQPVDYTISFNFDPTLFENTNNTNNVTLTVPPETTTRSVLSQPSNLFVKSNTTTTSGGGQ
jgi:hypothetical protein